MLDVRGASVDEVCFVLGALFFVLLLAGLKSTKYEVRRTKHKAPSTTYEVVCVIFQSTRCRGGGMADAADLKSVVRKDVRVRLPPSAPILFLRFSRLPST